MLKKVFVKKILGVSAALVLGAGIFTGCAAIADGAVDADSFVSERVALRTPGSNSGVYNVVYIPDMKKLIGDKDKGYKAVNVDDYTHICLYSVKLNRSNKLAVTESFYVNKENGTETEIRAFTDRFSKSKLDSFMSDIHSNHKNVKVVVCLGGGDDEIKDSHTQKALIYNYLKKDGGPEDLAEQLASMVKTYNLDGVDLDWEYFSSFSSYNKYYKKLAKALRAKLPREKGYSLSVAFPVDKSFVDSEIIEMCSYLDVVSVMSYKKKHYDVIRDYYQPKISAEKLTYGISYEKKDLDNSEKSTIVKDADTAKSLVKKLLDAGYKGIMAWDYKGDADLREATCKAIKDYKSSSTQPVNPDPKPDPEPEPEPDPDTSDVKLTFDEGFSPVVIDYFETSKSTGTLYKSSSSAIESYSWSSTNGGSLKCKVKSSAKGNIDVYIRYKNAPVGGTLKFDTWAANKDFGKSIRKISLLEELDDSGNVVKSLTGSGRDIPYANDYKFKTIEASKSIDKSSGWIHIRYYRDSAVSGESVYIDNFMIK